VFIVLSVYFVIGSLRKLLDTPTYVARDFALNSPIFCLQSVFMSFFSFTINSVHILPDICNRWAHNTDV